MMDRNKLNHAAFTARGSVPRSVLAAFGASMYPEVRARNAILAALERRAVQMHKITGRSVDVCKRGLVRIYGLSYVGDDAVYQKWKERTFLRLFREK